MSTSRKRILVIFFTSTVIIAMAVLCILSLSMNSSRTINNDNVNLLKRDLLSIDGVSKFEISFLGGTINIIVNVEKEHSDESIEQIFSCVKNHVNEMFLHSVSKTLFNHNNGDYDTYLSVRAQRDEILSCTGSYYDSFIRTNKDHDDYIWRIHE